MFLKNQDRLPPTYFKFIKKVLPAGFGPATFVVLIFHTEPFPALSGKLYRLPPIVGILYSILIRLAIPRFLSGNSGTLSKLHQVRGYLIPLSYGSKFETEYYNILKYIKFKESQKLSMITQYATQLYCDSLNYIVNWI